LETAKICLEQVIQIRPDYPDAYSNLGLIQIQEGLFMKAEQSFQQAIKLNPNSPDSFNNLGLAQLQENQFTEAELSFRQAIKLNRNFPEAYNNLGITLKDMDRLEEATRNLYQAIKLKPNYAEAYNSLGSVLTDTKQNEAAEACFCRAIHSKPNYPEPFHNLGVLLTNANRLEQAETCFDQALKLNPNFTEAEFSLATLYLLQGRYEQGWEKYDKSRMIQHNRFQPNIRRWNGEDLAGKKIVLYYEQGFGDTLHFVRYVEKVSKLALKTVLWVQKSLQRLITISFPTIEVHGTENVQDIACEEFDFSCPLPSLPRVFSTAAATIPQSIPYIKVGPDIIAKWGELLNHEISWDAYKIGIAWAGNPEHHNDRNRSIPLALFSDLLAIDRVNWISLQVGSELQKLADIPQNVFSQPQEMNDFAETAGLIAALDLVITVDSAVAHLAGAMGKKTWLLLPFAPDWRWQIDRDDNPWYPSMKLFRQRQADNWPEVLSRVKQALILEISKQSRTTKKNI